MKAIYRIFSSYSERQNALLGYQEKSYDVMRSFKVKQKRWNCFDRFRQS